MAEGTCPGATITSRGLGDVYKRQLRQEFRILHVLVWLVAQDETGEQVPVFLIHITGDPGGFVRRVFL